MDRHPGGRLDPLGYSAGPGQWLWDGHQVSLWAAQGAAQRGAQLLGFANSPPAWMTVSGCTSGSKDGASNNLARQHEADYVAYLVELARHYRDAWGVDFDYLDPINEPEADWWKANGGQDGCHVDAEQAARLFAQLAPALKAAGLKAKVIGPEAAYGNTVGYLDQLLKHPDAVAGLAVFCTHQYITDDGSQRAWARRGRVAGKPVWMSEWGDWKTGGWTQAANYAAKIAQAWRYLRCESWAMWEPALLADLQHGQVVRRKAFCATAQYTRYARPGTRLIEAADGSGQSLAFLDEAAHKVSIMLFNPAAEERRVRLDAQQLAGFKLLDAVRTSAAESLASVPPPVDPADVSLPPRSITTLTASYESLRPGLVRNPGFETGRPDGWTVEGEAGVEDSYPAGGYYDGFLHPHAAPAALRQQVRGLTPGRRYLLSASCAASGVEARLTAPGGSATVSGGGYRGYQVGFSAAGDGGARIAFEAPRADAKAWAVIDNVAVTPL